ncbi:hypothetical protein GDO81_000911 [Engystomops pustulosus]|uniref:Protein lin-54 homolog n=3 Tax=Engystomops pustulosus TaxID=76066 RepID=A0AAV7DBN3_ENGPU|nr:hypothetical protein GDO81_000911 [Engystomops pustulosus]
MSVVSAEVNSALPDEIMETGMSIADEDSIEAITISSPMAEEVPMETELEEIVEVSSSGECVTTSLVKEAFTAPSNHGGHLAAVVSVASNTSPAPSATAMKTVLQSGIHKLGAPLSGQVILNKTSELATSNRMIKQEKVYVTTLGKGSNPIVFIPQNAMSSTQKATQVQHVDSKGTPQQIKLVTIGGQSGVSSLTSAQLLNTAAKSSLHGQQIQNVQMAKPMVVNATPVRMSVPIVPAQAVKQVAPKPINAPIVTTSQPQQRLLMPATPLAQIQPNLTNLPVLTPAPGTGNMGYAVLPAQYVTQLQQSSYVSIASNAGIPGTQSSQNQPRVPLNGIMPSEATSRPRKPCNCTKSLCLKLYCDCFANGEFCNNCNCTNCYNNLEHENERQKAIKACLDRNPEAFKPKIGKGKEGESDRRHSKGCNCKRSGCLKNYCECYEAKIMCSSICKCIGCKNFEESPERKTLMHLADAAEVRVQQQTAAKTKLSSQISDLLTRPAPSHTSGGGKLPFTFVTKEVAEATCACLLAQAEEGEKLSKSKAVTERMILEEFGRCLMRVINSAGKAKSDPCPMSC